MKSHKKWVKYPHSPRPPQSNWATDQAAFVGGVFHQLLWRLYDALHDPAHKDILTRETDTGSGGYTQRYFRAPHSAEEMVQDRDAIADWAKIASRAGLPCAACVRPPAAVTTCRPVHRCVIFR